jgi:hypothetical protein
MKPKNLLNLAISVLMTGCVHTWRMETTTGTRTDYVLATNRDGTVSSVIQDRVELKDLDRGGAMTLLADPTAAQFLVNHTNQTGLGGSSTLSLGALKWDTSSNAAAVIDAAGGAAGTIIGDAAKAVAK